MKIDIQSVSTSRHIETMQLSTMLRILKKESGCELYDDSFEKWCKEEWKITFLHGNEVYPEHLTGLEMDDPTYTMLMLRFNL